MFTLIVGGDALRVFDRYEKCGAANDFRFESFVSLNKEGVAVWFDSSQKYSAWIQEGMPDHPEADEWVKEGLQAYAIITVKTELLLKPHLFADLHLRELTIKVFEVPPHKQKNGIGKAAMVQLLTLLKDLQVTHVRLLSVDDAKPFWRKVGFHPVDDFSNWFIINLQTQSIPVLEKPKLLTATGLVVVTGFDAKYVLDICEDNTPRSALSKFLFLKDVLAGRPSQMVAWLIDTELLAYALFDAQADELMDPKQTRSGSVQLLYFEVVPEKRGQGFGKAIIDDLLTRVSSKLSCVSLYPWCESEGFWVGRGFVGKSGTYELFNHVFGK